MSEDSLYCTSTQYKRWFFTTDQLAEQRRQINAQAGERVKAALKAGAAQDGEGPADIECLTPEEEYAFVNFYCTRLIALSDHQSFPNNVKCTAAQYLRRFYLNESPMTYHPKDIVLSSLFLATKTENHYVPLKTFAAAVPIPPETVLATEYLLLQSLRFMLDIRQPNRGLEGGIMELLSLTSGDASLLPPPLNTNADSSFLDLSSLVAALDPNPDPSHIKNRVMRAHGAAKELLTTSALVTDVYFLFTPAQIWLAALQIADAGLADFYITTKTSAPSTKPMQEQIEATVSACAEVLRKAPAISGANSKSDKADAVRIDKKLRKCSHPDTQNMEALHAAAKRNGGTTGVAAEEAEQKAAKKRKLAKEKREMEDDPFGPPMGK